MFSVLGGIGLKLPSLDEKNTKETVDAEGWVHTGDVAEMDECGRIRIIDRVKVCIPTLLTGFQH